MFDPVFGKLHVSRDVIFQEELGWEWENQGNNAQLDYFTVQHQFTVEDPATEASAENDGSGASEPPSPRTAQSTQSPGVQQEQLTPSIHSGSPTHSTPGVTPLSAHCSGIRFRTTTAEIQVADGFV
jgi:hypothetical protein